MKDQIGPFEIYVDDNLIDKIHKNKLVTINTINNYEANSCFILRSSNDLQKTALARLTEPNTLRKVNLRRNYSMSGIKPRDAKQYFFSELLVDQDQLMCVGLGPAGTGKTTLAIAHSLEQVFSKEKTLHLCKPTALVGKLKNTFGPVPGSIDDKYAPHVQHFSSVIEGVLGKKSAGYINLLFEKGDIRFTPVEYSRGMTFKDCIFILDEVQNLTWHELKTVCSRMGENSKLILLGDPDQIDRRFSLQESGIYNMLTSKAFKSSPFTSSIYLTEQYRGPIATLIADIDYEKREQQQRSNSNSDTRLTV